MAELTYEQSCGVNGANLGDDPCRTYIEASADKFLKNQMDRKDNAMAAARAAAQRVMDADRNSSVALIRSQNLYDSTGFINTINNSLTKNYDYDNDVSRRQFEINEYHYHNKLDTLFFLQLLFITVLIMAILIYFTRRGTLTPKMTGILTAVLAVVLILVAVSRYFYTNRIRDRRLWHRRYFQKEKTPQTYASTTCGPTPSRNAIDITGLFSQEEVACAAEANENVKKWFENQELEAKNQMAGTGIPGSIFQGLQVAGTPSCKRR